mmetsp:Transcript_58517/g.96577  ORF Transcript_58517/g.96577 Transcript_58517/m.96577 type:complete len:303 (+) Transcript_58517:47-955(+)
MERRRRRCVIIVRLMAVSLMAAAGESESERHYHDGLLTKYELGPPSILISQSDEVKLRTGKAVMQAVSADTIGTQRMVMVQDVRAPSNIVMRRIIDLERYPVMVDGVNSCVNYATSQENGVQTVSSKYDISALHLRFKYYMKHTIDSSQRCMTFHLDYDRRSDLDDSVGYWYVEPTGRATSRVFYSCECKLRGWVPGPVCKLLGKEAMKKATTWVAHESVKEWRSTRENSVNDAMVQFVSHFRSSVQQLNLPHASLPVQRWLASHRDAAVQFVSGVRPVVRTPVQLVSAVRPHKVQPSRTRS